jgi:hypothetical protein
MAQCDMCNAQDEDITEQMLKNICSTETDDYFFMHDENFICFDCYYIRDKWENNEERTTK